MAKGFVKEPSVQRVTHRRVTILVEIHIME